MNIKDWFISKNFTQNEQYIMSIANKVYKVNESEKAVQITWTTTKFGNMTKWIPKSCIKSEEEIQEERNAWEEKVSRYEKLVQWAKDNKIPGVRNKMKTTTIIAKIEAAGLQVPNFDKKEESIETSGDETSPEEVKENNKMEGEKMEDHKEEKFRSVNVPEGKITKREVKDIYDLGIIDVDILETMNREQLKLVNFIANNLQDYKKCYEEHVREIKELRTWSWQTSIRKMRNDVLHDQSISLQAYKRAYALLRDIKEGSPVTKSDFEGWKHSQVRENKHINYDEFKCKSREQLIQFIKDEFDRIEFFKKSKKFRRFI